MFCIVHFILSAMVNKPKCYLQHCFFSSWWRNKDASQFCSFRKGSQLKISYVSQDTAFLRGNLTDYAVATGIDESLFKTILQKLDFSRLQLEKDISDFSGMENGFPLYFNRGISFWLICFYTTYGLNSKYHLFIWKLDLAIDKSRPSKYIYY